MNERNRAPAHIHDDDGTVEGCPGCFYDALVESYAEAKRKLASTEPEPAIIRFRTDSGLYWEMLPHPTWSPEDFPPPTPEEQIDAAMRYMRRRLGEDDT